MLHNLLELTEKLETLANINAIRSGLATRLATISGLRVAAEQPDNPNPPLAVVIPDNTKYDDVFGRGMDTTTFRVILIVSRVAEKQAQKNLDAYCATTGTGSIKAAIEGDKTLGGSVFDCRVTEMRNYGQISVGDVTYLGCEFIILTYA
jgi:hypothetical protein